MASVSYQPPATPRAALLQARTVIGPLAAGPFLMWAVLWFVTSGGSAPREPVNEGFTASIGLGIWAVLAIGCFAAAMVFRGRALRAVEEGQRAGGYAGVFSRVPEIQTSLIVAMALLEGPALFAGVMFFLFGEPSLLVYAGVVFVAGVALTFPRAEWFGVDPRRG